MPGIPWVLFPEAIKTRRSEPRCGTVSGYGPTTALAGIRARIAAYPPARRNRAAQPSPTGPMNRRPSSGSPASSSTVAITPNRSAAA